MPTKIVNPFAQWPQVTSFGAFELLQFLQNLGGESQSRLALINPPQPLHVVSYHLDARFSLQDLHIVGGLSQSRCIRMVAPQSAQERSYHWLARSSLQALQILGGLSQSSCMWISHPQFSHDMVVHFDIVLSTLWLRTYNKRNHTLIQISALGNLGIGEHSCVVP